MCYIIKMSNGSVQFNEIISMFMGLWYSNVAQITKMGRDIEELRLRKTFLRPPFQQHLIHFVGNFLSMVPNLIISNGILTTYSSHSNITHHKSFMKLRCMHNKPMFFSENNSFSHCIRNQKIFHSK